MKKYTPKLLCASLVVMCALLVAVVAIGVTALYRRDAMITPHNFQQVSVGMPRNELHALLGPPIKQQLVLGIVQDAQTITVNLGGHVEQLRQHGFTVYVMDSWTSPTITITAFVDANDQVVCRYSSGGGSRTLPGRLWPRKRVSLTSAPAPIAPDAKQ